MIDLYGAHNEALIGSQDVRKRQHYVIRRLCGDESYTKGGVIFKTIQKFRRNQDCMIIECRLYDCLSGRKRMRIESTYMHT